MIATANENTVDAIVDLTQGLARIDPQREMNAKLLHDVHRIVLEYATRPRPDVTLNSNNLRAKDFSFRINDALKFLCESSFDISQFDSRYAKGKLLSNYALDEFSRFCIIIDKLSQYMDNVEFGKCIFYVTLLLTLQIIQI